MKLGILGGTFDPIHFGHLLTAEFARETLQLERVLFIPAGDPPHKQGVKKTAAHHRRKMVELAIGPNPHFELSPIDLERPGPHYSVDTIPLIRAQYGMAADDCYFIIGSDSLADLPTWHNPRQLITLCKLVVAHRPGYRPSVKNLEQDIPGLAARLVWVEIPEIDFAGSTIRNRVRAGRSIRYQVPEPVRAYIERHRLYGRS